jgi:predicted MFS family arabinose efflux permease
VNAVMAPNLVEDLGLDAAALGLLTSVYFLAFAGAQIPLGILLDRFGPRRSESALLLFAAAGATLFALADGLPLLILGRGLVGLGVAACLMAAFKAYRIWFAAERLPLVNGFQMVVGSLGALAATAPVEMALGHWHWRTLFFALGGLTLAAAALLFLAVPERAGQHQARGGLGEQAAGTLRVFRSPVFWRVAPVVVTTHSANFALQTLWAGPWLRDVAGLDRAAVANTLLLIAATMMAGFLLQGWLAERLQRVGVSVLAVMLAGSSAFMAVQVPIVLGWTGALAPMWTAFGLVSGIGILAYADLPKSFPAELSGRVITSLNLLVFGSAFVFQWGIGVVIGLWPASPSGGYDPAAYTSAFGIVLALEAASFAWYFLFRPSAVG